GRDKESVPMIPKPPPVNLSVVEIGWARQAFGEALDLNFLDMRSSLKHLDFEALRDTHIALQILTATVAAMVQVKVEATATAILAPDALPDYPYVDDKPVRHPSITAVSSEPAMRLYWPELEP